jgi:hypothetical protein
MHHLSHLRALDINQLQQFSLQAFLAFWGDVIFGSRRKGWQRQTFLVVAIAVVVFFGECFAHALGS